ncbi:hypothetical protein Tco_0609573 [Tanacetum coccineum]
MMYLCLHFTKDHEGNNINTPYPGKTNTPYSSYGNKIFWKISNVVPTPRNSQYAVSKTFDMPGDDEVELTNEESSYSDDEDEVAKIFRIETNVFDFETPLCRAFKEFNYLLQIDPDVLTKDIDGFKTYEEYKDDWIYEWNKDVPWVHKRPWTKNGWPTYSWKDDGYCNGGNSPGAYIIGAILRYQDLEWYDALKDSKLK